MFTKLIVAAFRVGVVTVSSQGQDALSVSVGPSQTSMPRSFAAINQQLRAALRQEATQQNAAVWAATVVELTGLYQELKEDPRLASSGTLESYRAKLRHRLRQIQERLQRDLRRAESRHTRSASANVDVAAAVARRLAFQLPLAGAGLGTPSMMFGMPGGMLAGNRGGAARTDYGPALVDLIQRTIAPEFWNVNGGPGAIAYYPLWYALGVRATGEVHGRVGGLTGALRGGH